ncbi:MAG: DUF6599 family protein [bacterium]
MRRSLFKIFWFVLLATVCSLSVVGKPESATGSSTAAAKSLLDTLAEFHARGPVSSVPNPSEEADSQSIVSHTSRTYLSQTGNTFVVDLVQTKMDSAAYSILTAAAILANQPIKLGAIGTATAIRPNSIVFFKGNTFVRVAPADPVPGDTSRENEINKLATAVAAQLDSGENDIPVLVKHLPNWETVQPRAAYIVSLQALKNLLPQQHALDVISFEGGAEGVLAHYDSGTLLIVEFNTATIAKDNDWNIRNKINEIRSPNQPGTATPSAYRRVGNYSVFVFDAPSEQVANELIDQVKYQQVVQWLGDDPYAYQRATREFTETTLGVFVSVVKASGLALVTCLAVGGFFGALLFSRRRAKQRNVEAYSDAGGMMRLNLDEMTPESDPTRLIGPGLR